MCRGEATRAIGSSFFKRLQPHQPIETCLKRRLLSSGPLRQLQSPRPRAHQNHHSTNLCGPPSFAHSPPRALQSAVSGSTLGKGLLLSLLAVGGLSIYLTMSAKLIPRHPSEVMVIRNITPNVVTLSVPFARFGSIKVGGRGTIVKLTSGALAVFSPVALTPEVKDKIRELGGSIGYIFAMDMEHHIFISEWAREFPEAKILGPEGLPEKRAKQVDDKIGKEPFFKVFVGKDKRQMTIAPEFDADFEWEYMDGHPNKELAFFYKPDRVLIEADILFNLPAREQYSRVTDVDKEKQPGVIGRFFQSIQTTEGDVTRTRRFLWYVLSRGNRPSFNESIQRIDSWDFTTLIPCHGDTIEENAKETFRKVFEWHLKGKD